MAGAWIFFTTFIALFITATAQCNKATCSPGGPGEACNRGKCNDVNGTCMTREDCINNPGGCVNKGKNKWCKNYKKCKCALPDVCTPKCNIENGMCMFRECKCDPGWRGETCDDFFCDNPACVNGFCTGPNDCTCDPGWIGPACDEFICDNPACVNGICTGPNNCTCDPGWREPACDEFYCDPDCQNGDTCEGPNNCAAACKNAKKCNNVNGICYHNSDPILQNCTNTFIGRYCSSKSCTCCW